MSSPFNHLEKTLYKAVEDHNEAPVFYNELMDSKIYVLGKPEVAKEGEFILEEEQAVIIQHWERGDDQSPVVPFFTSLEMLQNAIEVDEPYLELSTIDLFQLTIGAPLVLNPNSNLGMEFEPEDIALLLDTDLMENKKHTLDQKTEVLLGYAENISDVFVSVLSAFFKKNAEVEAAYLGTIKVPIDDDKEHLMVGIQGNGDLDKIIDIAIKKISLLEDDMMYETVDFYVIDQDDPDISAFMVENIAPFYLSDNKIVH